MVGVSAVSLWRAALGQKPPRSDRDRYDDNDNDHADCRGHGHGPGHHHDYGEPGFLRRGI